MTESSSVALAMSTLSGAAHVVLTQRARASQPHRVSPGQCSRRDRRGALVWVVAFSPAMRPEALSPRPLVCDEVVACVVEATGPICEEQVCRVGVVAVVGWAQAWRGSSEFAIPLLCWCILRGPLALTKICCTIDLGLLQEGAQAWHSSHIFASETRTPSPQPVGT